MDTLKDRITPPDARRRGFDCLCGNVRMASRALTALYDSLLEPTGLTANQLAVLWCVIAAEPVALGEVAGFLVMDKTTVSRCVAGLAGLGFVRSRAGDDARVKLTSSTAKGRRAFASAMPRWKAAQTLAERRMGRGTFARTVRDARRIARAVSRPA
jgi:DNA-binding MarR family transcriptional regulator